MVKSFILLFTIILFSIPFAYGAIHPQPAMYIVNTSAGEFGSINIIVGERFIMTWAIANRGAITGNTPMDNVVTQGILEEGVTWVGGNGLAMNNCTFDNATRNLKCTVQGQMPRTAGDNTTAERYEFLIRGDVAKFGTLPWSSKVTVCGDWLGNAQFPDPILGVCAEDKTFMDILPEPLQIIQSVNVTALHEKITHLESEAEEQKAKITILEAKVLALELKPDPEPIDLTNLTARITNLENAPDPEPINVTALENRINSLEQAWQAFQTAWSNVFG